METQGSEARSYWSAVGVPDAQASKGSVVSPQVLPPSNEKPATRPCAPPFDQRSCCQTPTMFEESAGFTATYGSTSAFVYTVPGPPMLHAAYGLGPDTSTRLAA